MSVPASAAKPPPGRWWYVVAGLIAAAAVAVTIYFVIHRVSGLTDRLVQVVVPGQASLTLNETGSYTIFHEYQSVVDGKVYSTGSVSDLRVTVAGPDGRRVSLTSPSGTSRYSIAGRAGSSIFAFEAAQPGVYRLAASYEDGRREPRTVLTVGTGFLAGIFMTVLITLAIMFAGIGSAVAIAIIVFLARRRALRAGAPA